MIVRVVGVNLDWQSRRRMGSGVCKKLGDGLLNQRVIDECQWNFRRYLQSDFVAIDRFTLNAYRCLQYFAHIAPFAFRANYSAFKPIHVEKVVYDAIEPPR